MDPSKVRSIKDDFKEVDQAVLTSANQAFECGTLLEEWDPADQEKLWDSVDAFLNSLKAIHNAAAQLPGDLRFPERAITYVDHGVNPTGHTRVEVDNVTAQSDSARGKMVQAELLRDSLDTLLAQWTGEIANPPASTTAEEGSQPAKPS